MYCFALFNTHSATAICCCPCRHWGKASLACLLALIALLVRLDLLPSLPLSHLCDCLTSPACVRPRRRGSPFQLQQSSFAQLRRTYSKVCAARSSHIRLCSALTACAHAAGVLKHEIITLSASSPCPFLLHDHARQRFSCCCTAAQHAGDAGNIWALPTGCPLKLPVTIITTHVNTLLTYSHCAAVHEC